MAKKRILTGIKPTGTPHLGNYLGAIKPALRQMESDLYQSFYFIADYHALTSIHDRKVMQELTYQVAATWLSLGLDPNKVIFYKQSDVPEILELQWILSCMTSKGLMNRAHAYKAVCQANEEKGADPDEGVNIGLFTYPVLMSADILAFEAELVPVGADQVQHVEIARDIAETFNHRYRSKVFKLPVAQIQPEVKVLPGLDGRKMSKSYDNTIPIFASPSTLKKLIGRMKTDSSAPSEPKTTEDSSLFILYREFATPEQVAEMEKRYREGIGWGEVKARLLEVLEVNLRGPREHYERLLQNKSEMDQILKDGAQRAREVAGSFLHRVKKEVGV